MLFGQLLRSVPAKRIVANHRDPLGLLSKLLDDGDLLLGEEFGPVLINADLCSDCSSRPLVVTREHDDALDALGVQLLDRVASTRTNLVGNGNDADEPIRCPDEYDRFSPILEVRHGLVHEIEILAVFAGLDRDRNTTVGCNVVVSEVESEFLEELWLSDVVLLTVESARHPPCQ